MSRVKTAQESAVLKTIAFLKDIKHCIDMGWHFSSTELQQNYHVSKSTFSQAKYFEIIKEKDGKLIWAKGEPDRQMALLILERLRQRQQKSVEATKLPGLDAQIDSIINILAEISDNTQKQNNAPQRPKMPVKEQSLFGEIDTKEQTRIKILCAVTSGLFNNFGFADNIPPNKVTDCISNLNGWAIVITDDLLKKLYSK